MIGNGDGADEVRRIDRREGLVGTWAGTFSDVILVADTAVPDGNIGTADDASGGPTFNAAGGGNSNAGYCSTSIDKSFVDGPPGAVAFNYLIA